MASLLIGPVGRRVERAYGERNYAHIIGAQTAVICAAGAGTLSAVICGVVNTGTTAKFYDTPAGGTTDPTTQMFTLDISVVKEVSSLELGFNRGLTCIVAGGAATEVTLSFIDSANDVSPRTFGV